ncbi:MAG: hypothetical protein WCC74_00495 [Minisyncoccia bacterium]
MQKSLLRKIFISSGAFVVISVIFSAVYCFGTNASDATNIVSNPLKVDNITDFISLVLTQIVKVGAVISVIFLVYVGWMFVEARGDTTKISKAREALWGTVIGIALLLGAQVLAVIIKGTVDALVK